VNVSFRRDQKEKKEDNGIMVLDSVALTCCVKAIAPLSVAFFFFFIGPHHATTLLKEVDNLSLKVFLF